MPLVRKLRYTSETSLDRQHFESLWARGWDGANIHVASCDLSSSFILRRDVSLGERTGTLCDEHRDIRVAFGPFRDSRTV